MAQMSKNEKMVYRYLKVGKTPKEIGILLGTTTKNILIIKNRLKKRGVLDEKEV